MDSGVEVLRRVGLFAGLSDEALGRVSRVAGARTYDPGEPIVFEGDPCRAAYFIAAGRVRVSRVSPEGREQVLAELGPGQSFNTVPPFQAQGVNHATVEAITEAILYVVAADALRDLVSECPEVALALLRDFAGRLDHLTDLVEDLSLRTVRGRLARFLLERADEAGVAQQWTQAEIAVRLGTVRDVVGRVLRDLAEAGLVRLERQRIVLLDRAGLEAEASAEYR